VSQRIFDLPPLRAFGRGDFLVSGSNAGAFEIIERWPQWPLPALVLYGPAGSGKTHLAHLWCERAGAPLVGGGNLGDIDPSSLARPVAIDDADRAPERALLHHYNAGVERRAAMLLVMRQAPAAAPIGLADLASRLRALPLVGIAPPDDALLAALLVKQFADRQLRVRPGVIAYLLPRMQRSFAGAAALADRLDRAGLSAGRPITVKLAREILGADQSLPPSDLTVT
jgi:chromosomal replication initiation ATPase DnaA